MIRHPERKYRLSLSSVINGAVDANINNFSLQCNFLNNHLVLDSKLLISEHLSFNVSFVKQ